MKTAVIYYSFEGHSAAVAEEIAQELKADIFELELVDNKKRTGFAKYAWGGFQALTGKKPPLKPYTIDVEKYGLIIIGGPVWAGSPAPALRTFLSGTKISGKKIGLFCCYGGGLGKYFGKLKKLLPGNTFAAELTIIPGKQTKGELDDKVEAWVQGIK
jgi:flavodoxin